MQICGVHELFLLFSKNSVLRRAKPLAMELIEVLRTMPLEVLQPVASEDVVRHQCGTHLRCMCAAAMDLHNSCRAPRHPLTDMQYEQKSRSWMLLALKDSKESFLLRRNSALLDPIDFLTPGQAWELIVCRTRVNRLPCKTSAPTLFLWPAR
eukprot:Skav202144  [mRNA]  locus=scaffold970:22643:23871:+ [translate_table: standard]